MGTLTILLPELWDTPLVPKLIRLNEMPAENLGRNLKFQQHQNLWSCSKHSDTRIYYEQCIFILCRCTLAHLCPSIEITIVVVPTPNQDPHCATQWINSNHCCLHPAFDHHVLSLSKYRKTQMSFITIITVACWEEFVLHTLTFQQPWFLLHTWTSWLSDILPCILDPEDAAIMKLNSHWFYMNERVIANEDLRNKALHSNCRSCLPCSRRWYDVTKFVSPQIKVAIAPDFSFLITIDARFQV